MAAHASQALRYVRSRMAHCTRGPTVEIQSDALIAFDANGEIKEVWRDAKAVDAQMMDVVKAARLDGRYMEGNAGQFLVPGFIDTHIHAPQYSYMGSGLDKPLLQWLDHYTFPAEAAFSDLDIAQEHYQRAVKKGLREGTTTAMYFATIHKEATKVLAHCLLEEGQRGFVGAVSMDVNPGVPHYGQQTEAALNDAEDLIVYLKSKLQQTQKRLMPVLTPRYVPTCSVELLKGLGHLAEKYDVHVQSHISESLDVLEEVDREHGVRDTYLFDDAKLLRPGSIFAHGVHLQEDELCLMAERGSSIAHCPLSNFFFAHGHLDVRRAFEAGVGVGLGSDVAGGYSISMLNAMRSAVLAHKAILIENKTRPDQLPQDNQVTHETGFYMATLGGAAALGLQDKIGSFEVGKRFDAVLVDLETPGNIDPMPTGLGKGRGGDASDAEDFERFINLADGRNIAKVWVDGHLVHAAEGYD
ncbi:hypothetical protein AAMO2058_001547500 [Amorphochlora amoebiformis]